MAEIAGLKLIVPSSVAGSGVSVSASGKVTFTAATSISVNDCFTSTYDNYVVVARVNGEGASNINLRLRWRASGSDNATASSYVRQELTADNTTVSGARVTSDFGEIGARGPGYTGYHLYSYGPALAQPTAARVVNVQNATGGIRIKDYAFTHNQSTAYDGFTLYPESSDITGALCVYGLSQ